MKDNFSQWQLFVDGHCHHWMGMWARYEPDGGLIERYQSERIFTLNADHTSAHQRNLHHKPSGLIVNEWALDRGIDWGLVHPHCETMVNFYLNDRTIFWVPRKSVDEFFGIEIILMMQSSRASVFATYDSDRHLSRFTLVREYQKGKTPVWSYELPTQASAFAPSQIEAPGLIGEYGTGETPTAPLQTEWARGHERSIIYFPDNIAFNVPTHFAPAQATDITDIMVDWLTPSGTAERRIARYRPDHELPLFISQSWSVASQNHV